MAVPESIDGKVTKAQFLAHAVEINDKADSDALTSGLAGKADTTALTTGLAGKADIAHTQASTTITDFTEAVQDVVNGLLVAGSNITLTYNDAANTLTIASSAAGADNPIWLGAGAFESTTGSAAHGVVAGRYVGMLFDASAEEAASATWDMPAAWSSVHADLYWTNAGAGSGNVQWDIRLDNAADEGTLISSGSGNVVTVAAPAQDVLKVTRIHTGTSLTAANLMNCRAIRNGNVGADTLANDATLLGVLFTKAS